MSHAGRWLLQAGRVGILFGLADAALLQWTAPVISAVAVIATAVTTGVLVAAVHVAGRAAASVARLEGEVALAAAFVGYESLRVAGARTASPAVWLVVCGALVGGLLWATGSRRRSAHLDIPVGVPLAVAYLAVLPWTAVTGSLQPGSADGASTGSAGPALALAGIVLVGVWMTRRDRATRAVELLVPCLVLVVTFALFTRDACGLTVRGEYRSDPTSATLGATSTDLVVVIVMDTVAAGRTGLYAPGLPTTPMLNEFAATSTLYENAWSEASWSLPSHASLLTGLLPHEHGAHRVLVRDPDDPARARVDVRPLTTSVPFLPERLAAGGIRTSLVAANYGFFSGTYGLTRGFERVYACPRNLPRLEAVAAPLWRRLPQLGSWLGSSFQTPYSARTMLGRALGEIERAKGSPAFVLVNLMDAHPPTFGEIHARRYPDVASLPARSQALRAYDLAIRSLDTAIGVFLDELEARGRLSSAMVVITSDHGETFWAESSAHASTLLPSETRIPLIVKEPGQTSPRREQSPTQLSDLARMIAAAFGMPAAAAPRSLPADLVLLENYLSLPEGQGPVVVPLDGFERSRPSQWSLVRGGWQLIWSDLDPPGLYPVTFPPGHVEDHSSTEREALAEMELQLQISLPDGVLEVDLVDETGTADAEALERLRALGYIQ